jgi:hypothetical protein
MPPKNFVVHGFGHAFLLRCAAAQKRLATTILIISASKNIKIQILKSKLKAQLSICLTILKTAS